MAFPYFTGKRSERRADGWKDIPPPGYGAETRPEYYDADPELVDAVNVALLMGKPLLLTGEPGTGKTQLAHRLAWELGFDTPLTFETKSNSAARDLFYTYNVLSRFYDAQCNKPGEDRGYITYHALGLAILLANSPETVEVLLPDDFSHTGPRRSVVLIDEIDKAPRDFPNDILNEIEQMYFRIPELGNRSVSAAPEMSPVTVITSNSEKHLPDPFLRRCVYHHIRFPEPDRMRRIVANRLRHIPLRSGASADPDEAFLADATALFFDLRDEDGRISRKPATAELIVWLQAMRELSDSPNPIAGDRECAVRTLGALVKSEDLDAARQFVRQWTPAES
jgi:MoxR-like ATPase